MCAWLKQAFKVVNAHYPNIDWTLGAKIPKTFRVPPTGPLPPFLKEPPPEVTAAAAHLDFVLDAYFYHDGGIGNIALKDVTEAWRRYYQLHLPKGA